MALTDLKVRKAKPKEQPYKMYDSQRLFVLVKSNGSKLWRQKYTHMGKEGLVTHGSCPDVSLRDDRDKRDKINEELAGGINTAVQKRLDQIKAETMARTTFLLVGEEFLQMAYDRELADATMRKKIWHIHALAEALHNRPINEITSAEILHLLKKVEHSGRRETAKKLHGTLSGVFRLAIVTLRAEHDPTQAIKEALLPVKVTKHTHPWTNGQAERMNQTIRDAAVKCLHSENHDQLRTHLADVPAAHTFARRLKAPNGLTPNEYICKIRTSKPDRFIPEPGHQITGLNREGHLKGVTAIWMQQRSALSISSRSAQAVLRSASSTSWVTTNPLVRSMPSNSQSLPSAA